MASSMTAATLMAAKAPTGSAQVKASRPAKVAAQTRLSGSAFTPRMAKPMTATRQTASRRSDVVTNVAAPGR